MFLLEDGTGGKELGSMVHNRVQMLWAQGHKVVHGNKMTDQLEK
jgi:hypothetical protein